MPFKLKVIKQFQKSMKTQGGNQNEQERSSLIFQSETHTKDKQHIQRIRSISRKRIVKKSLNMYQNDLKLYPIENRHVANFFNIIGINQEAIRNNQCGQSYFRTLFYLKNIKKIEIRPTCLILQLVDSPMQFPPLEYVVERFESFGDQRFHHLAQLMRVVAEKIKELEGVNTKPEREESHDFFERYIQSLGNRMYVCRISNNKMLLSRSLLLQLELNPEQFALEALRFRTPMHEAASTERYYEVIVKYMENMINLLDLVRDKISLETFLDSSVMRFKDYFFTKNNKRLYCKMKTGMPHPLVTIFELEEVISRAEQFQNSIYYGSKRLPELEGIRERIRRAQVNSVKGIMKLPANYLPQNEHKVTGYIQRIPQ